MMNHHLEAVARTRPRALLVADMPFLSFHISPEDTIRNARDFLQLGTDAGYVEDRQLLQEGLSRWAADVLNAAFPASQESCRLPDGLRDSIVNWAPSKSR